MFKRSKTDVDKDQNLVSAQDIVQRTFDLAKINTGTTTESPQFEEWLSEVRRAKSGVLIESTACLSSTPGKDTRDLKALREAIIAQVNLQNTELITSTMERLDESAERLTRWSIFLSFVAVGLAVIQVCQAAQIGIFKTRAADSSVIPHQVLSVYVHK